MSDASTEQEWFEKADQDLEMARRALGYAATKSESREGETTSG